MVPVESALATSRFWAALSSPLLLGDGEHFELVGPGLEDPVGSVVFVGVLWAPLLASYSFL